MKVVIVKEIERMPIDCDSCPFQGYDKYCGILGEYTALNEWVEDAPYYDLKEKGDCHLKPMPQKNKYDVEKYATVDYEHNVTLGHYLNKGWNACIEELEK